MARARAKNIHCGGEQLPLITPPSAWVAPAELPDLRRAGLVAIDLETRDDSLSAGRGPGWCYGAGHVAGVAAAWAGGEFYAPLRHPDGENMDEEAVRRWLGDHLACAKLQVVYHNAPYDTGWARAQWGLAPPVGLNCTLAMAVMVDENRLAYGLDDLCKWQGLPGKDETALREAAAAFGYHGDAVKGALWRLPARYVGPYAQADARATLGLFNALRPSLEAESTWDAFRLEMDLVPMCLEMRRRGIRVDLGGVARSRGALLVKRDGVLKELAKQLGVTALGMEQVRSPRWLEKAHDSQRIGYPRTAKTGQGSFTKDWMRGHAHWLPRLVSRADQLTEAADKFLKGFIQDYAHKGRIHASINQYRGESGDGTRSHRFSYSDPALQQAPSRDEELALIFRGAFLPEEGEVWGAHDVSQQEFRFIVHFAAALNQPRAAEAVQRYIDDPETDFHALVVEWTGLERPCAKDVNFAKAFEARVPKFAEMIKQPLEEAARIYKLYDEELPFVRGAAREAQLLAQTRGYIRLIDGARSHFDLWEPTWLDVGEYGRPRPLAMARKEWPEKRLRRAFTHKAFNRAVQGSAARQTKRFMLDCWRAGYVPLIQMHDDLNFSHKEEAEGLRINEIMRSAVKLRVPMVVDSEYGPNWGAARKIKDKAGKVIYGATWAEACALRDGKG